MKVVGSVLANATFDCTRNKTYSERWLKAPSQSQQSCKQLLRLNEGYNQQDSAFLS